MYLNKIIIENMGGIQEFKLDSDWLFKKDGNPKPIILIGKNGTGKTTLLGSIVDAWYELANHAFSDVTESTGYGHKYYKIQGGNNIRIGSKYSLSYISFKSSNGNQYKYIDKCGDIDNKALKEKTGDTIFLNDKELNKDRVKYSTKTRNDELFKQDFHNNSYCYFPSDRYETPYWMNEISKNKKETIKDRIDIWANTLGKEFTIYKSLDEIKEWILQVFLDTRTDLEFKQDGTIISRKNINDVHLFQKSVKNIELIISKILEKKITIDLNLRNQGLSRIKLIDKATGEDFIPSLDNLSAGQSTLLGIFATIIMYSDRAQLLKSINLHDIEGIVAIDEIDLHLHIKLQNEVIPELIKLFPKVQFIITTHSPFFLSGMSKTFNDDDYITISLPDGIQLIDIYYFEEFNRAYKLFNTLSVNYKEELDKLKNCLSKEKDSIFIMTEGKTDWRHLMTAFNELSSNYPNLKLQFLDDDKDTGDQQLEKYIKLLRRLPINRKTIAVFDRDNNKIFNKYSNSEFVKIDDNIYAMCIPKINDDLDRISIEYYYNKNDRLREDEKGRRLFDGMEFIEKTGNSLDGKYRSLDRNKIGKQKIIDSDVFNSNDLYGKNSVALSKKDFALHIFNKDKNFENVNFENFKRIFDIFEEIRLLN